MIAGMPVITSSSEPDDLSEPVSPRAGEEDSFCEPERHGEERRDAQQANEPDDRVERCRRPRRLAPEEIQAEDCGALITSVPVR